MNVRMWTEPNKEEQKLWFFPSKFLLVHSFSVWRSFTKANLLNIIWTHCCVLLVVCIFWYFSVHFCTDKFLGISFTLNIIFFSSFKPSRREKRKKDPIKRILLALLRCCVLRGFYELLLLVHICLRAKYFYSFVNVVLEWIRYSCKLTCVRNFSTNSCFK
jgi:hypothetical protein